MGRMEWTGSIQSCGVEQAFSTILGYHFGTIHITLIENCVFG